MTSLMVDGKRPYVAGWEDSLGADGEGEGGSSGGGGDVDESESNTSDDPPRLYVHGSRLPGCAFTRSIGYESAIEIGVTCKPEITQKARCEV